MAKRGRKLGSRLPIEGTSWEIIQRQFVQGVLQETGEVYYPTVSELSEIHGTSYSTIRRRMLEDNWVEKRDKWQKGLHKWVHAADSEDYVEAARKFDTSCVDVAQKGVHQILNYFNIAIANGEQVSQLDLDRMGRALVSYQRVGRLSLGLSTENNAIRAQEKTEQNNQSIIDASVLSPQELSILNLFAARVTTIEESVNENGI